MGVGPGEEVAHLGRRVIVDVAKCLDLGKPLHVTRVVGQPNSSVEGHLVILSQSKGTISSIDLESLLKIPSKRR